MSIHLRKRVNTYNLCTGDTFLFLNICPINALIITAIMVDNYSMLINNPRLWDKYKNMIQWVNNTSARIGDIHVNVYYDSYPDIES